MYERTHHGLENNKGNKREYLNLGILLLVPSVSSSYIFEFQEVCHPTLNQGCRIKL